MLRQIQCVRLLDVPGWLEAAGVQVWAGAGLANRPGYRIIWAYKGLSGDGKGKLTLTFLQERSCPAVDDRFRDDLRAYTLAWMADNAGANGSSV